LNPSSTFNNPEAIAIFVKKTAIELGFSFCAITDTHLEEHEAHLLSWLGNNFHGEEPSG